MNNLGKVFFVSEIPANGFALIVNQLGKGAKKNPKCKLFPKSGEGVNPKVYILKKSINSEKRLQN